MANQYVLADCGFFTSENGDRVYSADQMSNLYSGIVSNGVFPQGDLLVEPNGMGVTVNHGGGIFGGKWFNVENDVDFEVPLNGSAHTRVDSVIVRIDNRLTERTGKLIYIEGNSDSPPTINNLNNVVDYRIANISVPQGASSITSSNITDKRGSSECPFVTSLVNGSNTATLGNITKSTFDNLELEVGVLYTIGLAQGFLYTNSPAQSGYVVAVSESYIIIIASLDGVFYVYGAAGARSACDGAIGSHSIQDNAIKSSHIPNYTIAFSQLSQGLQDTINEMGQRITALENTVGTLNDQLEQALNGGGA